MDHDEFHRLLCQAVHLPETASPYEILALVEIAYHFYFLNRPAEDAQPMEALELATPDTEEPNS